MTDAIISLKSSMIDDQLQECKSSFIEKKGDMTVKIFLQSNDNQSTLFIELSNDIKMEFFRLKIDQEYLTQNSEMSFCFETPEDLFYTLLELFEEVQISEEGVVIFEVKLNASKLKKKVFKLQVLKQEMEQGQVLRLKFDSLRKQLKAEGISRQKKVESLFQQIRSLKEQMTALKEQILDLRKQGEESALQGKKKDFKMISLSKENQLQRQQLLILRKSLQEFYKKFSMQQFYCFYDNPHWHHFSLCRGHQSVHIVKKDGDGVWHSFIRNVPLPEGKVQQFKVKQIKTNCRNVMTGICTRSAFGVANAYKTKQSLAYNAYSGNIWQKGAAKKGGPSIIDGQVVTIQVNMVQYRIAWLIDGKKVTEALINQQFRNKQVFLCFQLYDIQDEVQLMFY